MLFGCTASTSDYDKVAQAGFDYIELPCKHIVSMDDADFSIFSKKVSNGPIPALAMNLYCPPEIAIIGPRFNLMSAQAYARKAAQRASALGVQIVGIGSPLSRTLPEGYDDGLAMRQLKVFLSSTADIFGEKEITVCFESLAAVYCNFVNYLCEAVDIVTDLAHPWLRVVLDFYNMEHMGEADADLVPVIQMIHHAHLSDDECGNPKQRSYLLPQKAVDHIHRIHRLVATGYNKTLTLEIDLPVDIPRAQASLAVMRCSTTSY